MRLSTSGFQSDFTCRACIVPLKELPVAAAAALSMYSILLASPYQSQNKDGSHPSRSVPLLSAYQTLECRLVEDEIYVLYGALLRIITFDNSIEQGKMYYDDVRY